MQHENLADVIELPANNKVLLCGTVTKVNETNEEDTYDLVLGVTRLSGMQDKIPVILSKELKETQFQIDQVITISGIFTSFNKIVDGRSKLILVVMVNEIYEPVDQDYDNPNVIELIGYVCKAPIYRTTPFNREIADLLLAVNRTGTKSDYIPAIAWGKNARFAKNLLVGEKICVAGRIQSREYQKRLDDDKVETRTAYEVSICGITRWEELGE
ncbi:MAG: single-stranded DNA-binding protein [Firmicutes bacterium]|nr:single-stranded DNA-binding protein [Bacillota bacterium]